MFPDVRVTVFDPFAQTVLCLDANTSGDIGSSSVIKYEDTPAGNAAATIPLALTLSEVTARGYWLGMNIVEISACDNLMTEACSAGATKIYVDSTARFDQTKGEDVQQAYFWDGATLTMRVPVTGIGSDSGGPYITIGTPLTGGGNPTTLPAYGIGTYVGARRYCGRIMRRTRPNAKLPQVVVTCVGLGATGGMFDKTYGTFAATAQDVGPLIYQTLEQFASRSGWQAVNLNSSNFATIGTQVTMTLDTSPLSQWFDQIITAIPTGDVWTVRMGHDRTPRMVKLYTSATNSYTYPLTLQQNVTDFEPVQVEIDDEDVTNLYNSIEVIGDTDPATNQPVADIGQDATSISLYGQVDGAPQTVTGLKAVTDCQSYAVSLLNESSGPASNNKFRVYTTVAGPTAHNMPAGLSNGDVVRGVNEVIITGFNDTGTVANMVPDSSAFYTSGPDALWSLSGTTFSVVAGGNPYNRFELDGGAGGLTNVTSTAQSDTIAVAAGRIYSLSAYIDATGFTTSGVTGAQMSWNVLDAQTLAVITSVSQSPGASGIQTSLSFTIPNGTTRVVIEAIFKGNVTASHSVSMSRPMLVVGSTLPSSYIVNSAIPHVYGLVASVATTIDLHGMQYQDCQFAAVEPDWNAQMAERSQGLANALRQNTLPPVAIGQYCVSFEAFPHSGGHLAIPTSGLTVNPPTFLALFASGTNIQTVTGASFTLQPKCTNWAWLNPNLTWTVQQSPSPVSGSILYAIFQTSNAAVIGQTQKAPVGVMKIGLGNVNVAANLAAPAVSNNGALTNVASTHPTQADISASVNLTNVPQDGSAHSLYWAFREHGTTQWIAYAEDDLAGIPNPPASQTKGYVYAQMANGKLYDFAVGYVAFAGYGPPTQIGTTSQQSNGFAAKTLLVDLRYLDNGSLVSPTTSRSEIPTTLTTTTLGSAVAAGVSTFPTSSTSGFSAGDNIIIDDEPLTIQSINAGVSIVTTTNSVNAHSAGAPIVEALVLTGSGITSVGQTTFTVNDNSMFSATAIGQTINIGGTDSLTIVSTSGAHSVTVASPGAASTHAAGTIVYWEYAQNGISANGASSEVTLSFDITNQPTDDTFAFVHVWYRVHGGTGKWADAGAQAAVGTTTNPKTTPARDSYVFGIADLTNGQNYDFAVSMQSGAWHESAKHVVVSNFQANALNLGTGSLPKIPTGTTITASGSITGYTAVNGGAYHASYSVTPVVTPPSTDPRAFNQWGAGFAIYAKVRNQSASTTTTLSANYNTPGTTGPFSVGNASNMNAGAIVLMINTSGQVDSLVINTVNVGANTFTTTTGTAYAHANGDTVAFTSTDTTRADYSLVDELCTTTWNGATLTGITGGLSAGNAYQLAIMPIDEQNNPGPIAIFALTQAQYIGSGSVLDAPNLVRDPEMLHGTPGGTSGNYVAAPYWAIYAGALGIDGSTIYIGPGSHSGSNCLQILSDAGGGSVGASGTNIQMMSEAIKLQAGVEYCLSAYIDALTTQASGVSGSGNPSISIVSHSTGTAWDPVLNDPNGGSFAPQSSLIRAEITQTYGARGIVSITYTPGSNESVSILFQSHGSKVTGIQVFGIPMLQVGSAPGPFNTGATAKGPRPAIAMTSDWTSPLGPVDTQNGAALNTGGGYHDHRTHSLAVQSAIRTVSPYDWTANAGYYALGNLGFTNENGEQFFADQSNYVPDIPLASGTIWHCEALIRKGSGAGTTSTTCGLGFWNADESSVLVDAYWIELPSSGYPQIVYYDSGGTRHVIYTSGTAVPSRTYYSFKMTITVGSTNTIEASIDNQILPIQTDANLSITSWTDATGVVQTAGYDGTVSHDHMTHSVPHHTHQSLQTQNVVAKTADSHGSLLAHSQVYQEHIVGMTGTGNVSLDGLPDGATYARVKGADMTSGHVTKTGSSGAYSIKGVGDAQTLSLDSEIADGSTYNRVKATELTSGTVKQLNDGTNVRTAGIVATALASAADTFSSAINYGQVHRLLSEVTGQPGPTNHLYNPTFNTPAGSAATAGWSGPYQNTGSGTWTWTTDLYGGGRLIASPSATTAGSQFYQQEVTGLLSGNTYCISGTMLFVNTSGTTGAGVTLQVTGVTTSTVYASLVLNGAGTTGPKTLAKAFTLSGDTAVIVYLIVNNGSSGGSVTATFAKMQLEANSQPGAFGDHYAAKNANQSHDVNANFQYVQFPGAVLTSDGSLTQFAATGSASAATYPLATNLPVEVSAWIAAGSTSSDVNLLLGNTTNGYGLRWGSATGTVTVVSYKASVPTIIGTLGTNILGTNTIDTAYHSYRLSVMVLSSSQCIVEASFSSSNASLLFMTPTTDSSAPNLTAGKPVTILAGGTAGKVLNFTVQPRMLYQMSSFPYANVVGAKTGQVNTVTGFLNGGVALGSDSGPSFNVGSGNPNGVVSANSGSIYLRTSGSTGARLYVCSSGTTWAAVSGV